MCFSVFSLKKNNELILVYIKKKNLNNKREKFSIHSWGWKAVFTFSGFQLVLLWCLPKRIIARKQREPPPPQPKKETLLLRMVRVLQGTSHVSSCNISEWLVHAKESCPLVSYLIHWMESMMKRLFSSEDCCKQVFGFS